MPKIHSQSIISESAQLADDVEVGPFVVIEAGVSIAAGCRIASHAKICRGVKMGRNNMVDHGAVLGGAPQDLSFDPKIDSGVIIGDDNNFREHVTISRSTKVNGNTIIGDRNFFMAVSHIAHDVIVGDDNIFANNVMIAGHVRIANKVFLGGGTAIHQFTHVGDFAMSQGNSTLTKDVPPYCVAHKINQLSGLNVIGLRRGGFTPEDRKEIKRAYSLVLRSKSNREEALKEAEGQGFGPLATRLIKAVRSPSSRGVLTR